MEGETRTSELPLLFNSQELGAIYTFTTTSTNPELFREVTVLTAEGPGTFGQFMNSGEADFQIRSAAGDPSFEVRWQCKLSIVWLLGVDLVKS